MKIFSLFALVCLFAACSSSSSTDHTKTFSGNKFQVELVMDTTAPEYQMMKGMLASLDIKMDFKADGKMTYSASMGEMTGPDQVFDWTVVKDSLFTTDPEGAKEGYKITGVEGDKVFMATDSVKFILKKLPS